MLVEATDPTKNPISFTGHEPAPIAVPAEQDAVHARRQRRSGTTKVDVRHTNEVARLRELHAQATSPALANLIADAIPLKEAMHQALLAWNEIDNLSLGRGGPDRVPSEEEERASEAAWQACRTVVENIGIDITEAPIADARDALIRAEVYIQLIDCRPSANLRPDCQEDAMVMLDSYEAALKELASRTPDRTAWIEIERRRRHNNKELDRLCRQDDQLREGKLVFEEGLGLREEHDHRLKAAYDLKDELDNRILAMQPGDVGDLLLQLEVTLDHSTGLDVGSYASRKRIMADVGLSVQRMETGEELNGVDHIDVNRAFAAIAQNAAVLRDRHLPKDWRTMLDGLGWRAPGTADTIRRCYLAGRAADEVSDVSFNERLTGGFGLTFKRDQGRGGFADAEGCWIECPTPGHETYQ